MSRSLTLFLLLLSLVRIASGANTVNDYLGKTPAQVVVLGRTKWFEFYTSKQGESTLAMCSAEGLFGEALLSVNNSKVRKLPKAKQIAITKLRIQLTNLGGDSVTLGMVLSGGGTLWTPISAGVLADVEEVVAEILSRNAVSHDDRDDEIILLLDRLDLIIQGSETDISQDSAGLGLSFGKVAELLARFREGTLTCLADCRALGAKDSGAVRAYLKKVVKRPLVAFQ